MAATRLISMHKAKGKTLLQSIKDRIDYSVNPAKTQGKKYVSTFECDTETAAEEFYLSKRQYEHITGKSQEKDVILYMIRQSFKPGEISPEDTNQLGRELADRFLKGKHAYIVSTHTDRAHIHNHIIFNSTTLDCTHKFKNFFLSGLAIQRLSDLICLENGLSVIKPKPYRERAKRTEYPKKRSQRNDLCVAIDQALRQKPKDFDALIKLIVDMGYEFQDGKYKAFRGKDGKRFIRLRSLGEGYSEEELRAVLSGKSLHKAKNTSKQAHSVPEKRFSMLIDIEKALAEGKNGGYVRWAKKFNRKELSKIYLFIRESGLDNFDELVAHTEMLSNRFSELSDSIKAAEKRIAEIHVLKTHIKNYRETKDVYVAYRKAGYSKKFFEEHRDAILLHKAAKEAFDQLPDKKIPKYAELNEEFNRLINQKKQDYAEYRKVKKDMQEFQIAKRAMEVVMNKDRQQEEEQERKTIR